MRFPFLSIAVFQTLVVAAQESNAGIMASQTASFTYANDFFTATDRYFTQGVGLRYGSTVLGRSFLRAPLLRLHSDPAPWLTLLAQQDCYTPASIRTDTIPF